MSSSTSSFDATPLDPALTRPIPGGRWWFTWLLAIALFSCGIGSLERYWRHYGLVPTVDDSRELWSYERDKAYVPFYTPWRKRLLLVGGSRLLCDADLDVLARRLPGYEIAQLSIMAKTPIATLRDLAEDPAVHDITVVVDVAEHALERGNWPEQEPWVQYFHQRKNLAADFEIHAAAWLKSKLVVVNPVVGFSSLMAGHMPKRDYVTYGADRSCKSDYAMVDAAKARSARSARVKQVYGLSKPPDPASWLEQARGADEFARKLAERGVRVAFLRPPTTGDHWTLDAQRYPPELYWDAFEKVASVPAIHFKEEPGMDRFDAPDGSHLDVRQTGPFTECLVDALVRHRLVDVAPGAPPSQCATGP